MAVKQKSYTWQLLGYLLAATIAAFAGVTFYLNKETNPYHTSLQNPVFDEQQKLWKWVNWAGNVESTAKYYHQPETREDLIRVIKEASHAGEKIKIVSGGHSFSPLAMTDANTTSHLVNLDKYSRVLHVDKEKHQVTVQSGIRLHDLIQVLRQNNLSLLNMGHSNHHSLAGAIATSVHGSGINHGSIASQVVALEVITCHGTVLGASAEKNQAVFNSARAGLGVIGVISNITLQVAPAFNVHKVEEQHKIDYVLGHLNTLIQKNDYFSFSWIPHSDYAVTTEINKTEKPVTTIHAAQKWLDNVANPNSIALMLKGLSYVPKYIPAFNKFVMKHVTSPKRDYVAESHEAFQTVIPDQYLDLEYYVPVEKANEVFREVRKLVESENSGIYANWGLNVRFVKADNIFLSPTYKQNSAAFSLSLYAPSVEQASKYHAAAEKLFAKYKARPSFSSNHSLTHQQVRKLYPKFADFVQVREAVDPEKTFLNSYTSSLLYGK